MKHIITIITLLLFVVPAFAQDGKPETLNRHQNAFRLTEPQLLEYPNLGLAAGLAQSPQGYSVHLSDVVPSGSLVGIWGKQLSGSSVTHVLLLNQGREWAAKAEVYPQRWFGLETLSLRLPDEIHGEVIIKAIGENRNSNKVRILVE